MLIGVIYDNGKAIVVGLLNKYMTQVHSVICDPDEIATAIEECCV